MGLSFHYSGSIARPELLPELIDEVRDIAKVHHWDVHEFEREFPEGAFGKDEFNQDVYGVVFSPPECEPVWICFLSNGRISSPMHLQFWGEAKEPPESEYLYMISVKTQYAGIEIHQFVIDLFRYLSEKYFSSFELKDEGEYWETNDIEVLKANFNKYTSLMNSFTSALEIIPKVSGESLEEYFLRLMKMIRDRGDKEV